MNWKEKIVMKHQWMEKRKNRLQSVDYDLFRSLKGLCELCRPIWRISMVVSGRLAAATKNIKTPQMLVRMNLTCPLSNIRAKRLIIVFAFFFWKRTPKLGKVINFASYKLIGVKSGIKFLIALWPAAEGTLLPVAQLLAAATLIFCSLLTAVEHV